MIDFKKFLNKKQFEAANIVDGSCLVIAGAGTGKTATITYRTARLIEKGIDPESILLITFTNKAAKEMKTRIVELIGTNGTKVTAQTFHSFCANVLRHHSKKLGIGNNYTIIDPEDEKSILDDIIEDVESYENQLPKSCIFLSLLTYARNCETKTIGKYPYISSTAVNYFASNFISEYKNIQDVVNRFTDYKYSHNYLDYDDLIVLTNRLFETCSTVASEYANHFKYIMVDEYQDSNDIQVSLIKNMIKGVHNNVMAVGDDMQSMYSWRGANVKNILNFSNDFPNAKLIILEENYRSGQGILNLANAILDGAKEKYPKNLRATIEDNTRPKLLKATTCDEEYSNILYQIQNLIRFGNNYDDIAILTRSSSVPKLEFTLNQYKVPYVKYGGMKLFDKAHMKDVISILKILDNDKDELAWMRLLKMQEGVGKKTAEKVLEEIKDKSYDGLLEFKKKKFGKNLEELHTFLIDCKKQSNVESVLEKIIEDMDGFYFKYLTKTYPKDCDTRLQELEEFIKMSYDYEKIGDFLNDVILEGVNDPNSDASGKVILSTVHSAKGLEFKYVFIADCTEGNFPSVKAKSEDAIEEERRIFYVAITRAKKELFICVPRMMYNWKGYQYTEMSPFLQENNIVRNYLD